MDLLVHNSVAAMAFFQLGGNQLNTFETFLNQAVNGIQSHGIISGMSNVAYVVMLIGFLWEVYHSLLSGGDVKSFGRAAVKYLACALVVQYWPQIFTDVNGAFVNAGSWMTGQGGVGNVLDTWKTEIQNEYNQLGVTHMWNLVTGAVSGLIDAVLIFVAYLLYPIVTIIFGFFYIMMGSILYIFGPLIVALLPLAPAQRLAKAYIEHVFIWNAWPILYGGLGLLISFVNIGNVGNILNANSFLGGLNGMEGSLLTGIISIVYSIAIVAIPFMARSIVTGNVGAAARSMIAAAGTALTLGAAAGAGAIAGASAGANTAGAGAGGGLGKTAPAAKNGAPVGQSNQPPAPTPPPPTATPPANNTANNATNPSSGNQPAAPTTTPPAGDQSTVADSAPSSAAPDAPASPAGGDASGDATTSGSDPGNGTVADSEGRSGDTSSMSPMEKAVAANIPQAKQDAGTFKSISDASPTGTTAPTGSGDSATPTGKAGDEKPSGAPNQTASAPSQGNRQSAGNAGSGSSRIAGGAFSGGPRLPGGIGTWAAYHTARLATQGAVGGAVRVGQGVNIASEAISRALAANKSSEEQHNDA